MSYVSIAIRALIATVFLVSFAGKVRGRRGFGEFVSSVRALRLLPSAVAPATAATVVALEFAAFALTVAPNRVVAVVGQALAAVLLAGFAGAIAVALRRGVREPCRCFGASAAPLGATHVVRNVVLAGSAIAGAALTGLAGSGAHPAGVLVAGSAGVVLASLVVFLDDVLALYRPPTPAAVHHGSPGR